MHVSHGIGVETAATDEMGRKLCIKSLVRGLSAKTGSRNGSANAILALLWSATTLVSYFFCLLLLWSTEF
jgi:hypothetical protein